MSSEGRARLAGAATAAGAILALPTGAPNGGWRFHGPHGGGLSENVRGKIVTISEMIRGLMDFDVEPGFSVGAGLCVVLDSSGTGFLLVREDGRIVLEWGAGGGMVSVTVSDLSPSEKRAITRVFRAICPRFTPDWGVWEGMRRRALGCRTMLAGKPLRGVGAS